LGTFQGWRWSWIYFINIYT